jgi:hypothetical protein
MFCYQGLSDCGDIVACITLTCDMVWKIDKLDVLPIIGARVLQESVEEP